ncbi:MAG TPA: transcription antitermination factor NusB [Prolixibacteraceae bacterium]|nr:transcription antitermination factor NusB [Prolixibacteraceae bacterium]
MISRRIIRIKAMQSLYAFHTLPEQSINLAEKELFFSINKSYELYHLLLQLLLEIRDFSLNRIEVNRNKKIPLHEDLNPNLKFVKNEILIKLSENEALKSFLDKSKLSWINTPEFIKKIHNEFTSTEEYLQYMAGGLNNFTEDRKLVEFLLEHVIAVSEDLEQLLEEQSIYWNDDLEFVVSMIHKTIKKIKPGSSENMPLLPLFKDDEDLQFTKNLFRKAVLNTEEHKEIIKKHLRNWDLERVAFIDVVIMELAVTEFIYFPSIPTKVSLNEYIDIAKFYSTEKSKTFINGILDKIVKDLKEEGKIIKAGRGLIGE